MRSASGSSRIWRVLASLVVDDNAQAREILTDALADSALRPESVSSGEDAHREVGRGGRKGSISTRLDGLAHARAWTACRRAGLIKRGDRLKHIPKIAMVTAFGSGGYPRASGGDWDSKLSNEARQPIAAETR